MRYGGYDYFYHKNHLGSITAMTDISQNIVKEYEYDAFGNILSETSPPGDPGHNAFTYTAREYHSPSGLYYYRARFYDPVIGRFITQDPIGMLGGVNLYAYVGNGPTAFVDPFGFCEEDEAGWLDWLMNDLIVPGPYGSPHPDDWGEWVSLPYEAGKFGEKYENMVWGAIWTGVAADLMAGGLIGAEALGIEITVMSDGNVFKIVSKTLKRGFRIDPAHHGKPWGHMEYWKW